MDEDINSLLQKCISKVEQMEKFFANDLKRVKFLRIDLMKIKNELRKNE